MTDTQLRRAAQYVRMSTEHQNYSIEHQSAANLAYACDQGVEIVRTYADRGISGLSISRRDGLKALLSDILSGKADFDVVVVYDVSRWGRFQDLDEGAHYEFICRSAGVRIEYSAEPFPNDGSLVATLVKHLKRAMAAEYSRELSAKVAGARNGLAAKGYWVGGAAPYGYRRAMVTPAGDRVAILERGQQKALLGHRSILVAGPPQEVETVRLIFRMFVVWGLSMRSIAQRLGEAGSAPDAEHSWTTWRVLQVLRNETYIGTLVIGKRRTVLKRSTSQPKATWQRSRGACPVLVNPRLFELAQLNIRDRRQGGTDEDLLEALRDLWRRKGRLSHGLLAQDRATRSAGAYIRRFGSLERAFEQVGYQRTPRQIGEAARIRISQPHRHRLYPKALPDEVMIEKLRALLAAHGKLSCEIINRAEGVPCEFTYRRRFGSLRRAYRLAGYIPSDAQLQRFHA